MQGHRRLALAVAIGFHCILRSSELLGVRGDHCTRVQAGTWVIELPATKSGGKNRDKESVTVHDPIVIALLEEALRETPEDILFNWEFGVLTSDFRFLAAFFGISHGRLSLYSLRRGGASHNFLKYGSLDRTKLRGRWQNETTGRLYIEGAAACLRDLAVGPDTKARLHELARWLPVLSRRPKPRLRV